jgi:hypothetical protein
MKKTLVALMLMAGSTFAQYPNSASAGAGAPGYDPSAGGYGAPSSAYPAPGQDPYPMGAGAGAPGNYPPAGGYGAPAGAYAGPAACGPGYVWIEGYNDANGYFVNGYCAVPPFSGAYWVAPGFFAGRFVAGYWGRGGLGYAPGLGFRGGYGANYGVRGGYSAGSRFGGGYANGFHAPAASARSFRSQSAAPSVHSQGSYRGGGSAMRGGGSAMHGGGSGHGGRR